MSGEAKVLRAILYAVAVYGLLVAGTFPVRESVIGDSLREMTAVLCLVIALAGLAASASGPGRSRPHPPPRSDPDRPEPAATVRRDAFPPR
jgi:hypothetical protein